MRIILLLVIPLLYSSCVAGQKEQQESNTQEELLNEEIFEDYLFPFSVSLKDENHEVIFRNNKVTFVV